MVIILKECGLKINKYLVKPNSIGVNLEVLLLEMLLNRHLMVLVDFNAMNFNIKANLRMEKFKGLVKLYTLMGINLKVTG